MKMKKKNTPDTPKIGNELVQLIKQDVPFGKCELKQLWNSLRQKNKRAAARQNQQHECAPSEESDQPGNPPSLIRVFAVCSMGS